MSDIIAVLCSDVHLSHLPPLARSAEPDWYAAMERTLTEIFDITQANACPLIIAGDIFHKWNSPAELINFAIVQFSKFSAVYAIPGQHDLPGHSYEESFRSAYKSLIVSSVVIDLLPAAPTFIRGGIIASAFPWGFPVTSIEENPAGKLIQLAVVHAYIWDTGFSYPGADENKFIGKIKKSVAGYHAAVFGDNHKGFQNGNILNSGGLFRRNIDEIGYKPSVGLLLKDGSIRRHFLDISKDVFIETDKYLAIEEGELDFEEYIEELRSMGISTLDFKQELNRKMDASKTCSSVRQIIGSILES